MKAVAIVSGWISCADETGERRVIPTGTRIRIESRAGGAGRYSPTLKENPAKIKIRVNIRKIMIESTLGVTISVDGGASG